MRYVEHMLTKYCVITNLQYTAGAIKKEREREIGCLLFNNNKMYVYLKKIDTSWLKTW